MEEELFEVKEPLARPVYGRVDTSLLQGNAIATQGLALTENVPLVDAVAQEVMKQHWNRFEEGKTWVERITGMEVTIPFGPRQFNDAWTPQWTRESPSIFGIVFGLVLESISTLGIVPSAIVAQGLETLSSKYVGKLVKSKTIERGKAANTTRAKITPLNRYATKAYVFNQAAQFAAIFGTGLFPTEWWKEIRVGSGESVGGPRYGPGGYSPWGDPSIPI